MPTLAPADKPPPPPGDEEGDVVTRAVGTSGTEAEVDVLDVREVLDVLDVKLVGELARDARGQRKKPGLQKYNEVLSALKSAR